MTYKDKIKQREASRERQRRYKAKQKGVTSEGVTEKALPTNVTVAEAFVDGYKKTIEQACEESTLTDVVSAKPEPHGCKGCKLVERVASHLGCPKGQAPTLSMVVFEQAVNPEQDCEE